MSIQKDIESFKAALDAEHTFPTTYKFKFIVPQAKEEELRSLFAEEQLDVKASKGGKYLSYTLNKKVASSEEIIAIYQRAYKVEGIISL